jgi:hypothetical protein
MSLLVDEAQVEARFSPFWTHLIELQGHVGLVESRFGPFEDSVGVGAR